MKDFQYITNSHPDYIENIYNDFLKDPNSIDQEMRKFFEGFDFAVSSNKVTASESRAGAVADSGNSLNKEFAVYQLIEAYRKKSHLIANTNPIRERRDRKANLDISNVLSSDAILSLYILNSWWYFRAVL